MPAHTKSVAMTISVTRNATAETMDASKEPRQPEPKASRKAMKASPQAMGWRIMTLVSASAVSPLAVLKPVPSISAMMAAGS